MAIHKDQTKRNDPESYLDYESSLKKYIDANPLRTADTKAKAAQYFAILNRIEYVIELDAKYSESSFLLFWRKFNTLYNMMHRSEDVKDPIEVYFDNQIGIIEVETGEIKEKKKKPMTILPSYIDDIERSTARRPADISSKKWTTWLISCVMILRSM